MNPSQSIMNDQHRAMPWQWEKIERNHHHAEFSCLLELHDRIKALEATQHAHVDLSHLSDAERETMAQELAQAADFAPRWSEFARCADSIDALNEAKPSQPNHPAKPDSSLVERVAEAMQPGTFDWSAYEGEARAAIRKVAAWLREEKPHMAGNCSSFASLLEQEAER